ncbi:hypothetical protein IT570_14485 [Candidatus Sumerlaeota bacterium]|nr:hypothetical protein [Candidatus Sumerlaeota bacterium]
MASFFDFTIAGIAFRVGGDDNCVEHIDRLFGAFPKPVGTPDWSLRWNGNLCHYQPGAAPIRIPSAVFAPSCSTILIGYLLRESLPDAVFLHGNAIVRNDGRLLILLGDSGAGKTTLSQEFLSPGLWRLAAEDFLIVDSTSGQLHPYPRAASIRMEHQKGGKTHKPVSRFSPECHSLVDSSVILLKVAAGQESAAQSSSTTLWLSSLPSNLDEAMAELKVTNYQAIETENFHAVAFDQISPSQMYLVARRLLQSGALPLGTTNTREEGNSVVRAFPSEPGGREISMSDGLHHVMAHRVNFPTRIVPAGRDYMMLAKIFSASRCFEITPGGTPRRTADFIDGLID